MELSCIAGGVHSPLDKQLAAIPPLGIYLREMEIYIHKSHLYKVHGKKEKKRNLTDEQQ